MSSVLRHVAKYRPEWTVGYQAEEGRHQVGRGIVSDTFESPPPGAHYDAEVLVCLYDTWAGWHDRPNTRVSSTLHEQFGLAWDSECARYRVQVSSQARQEVNPMVPVRGVAFHYAGDSSPDRKNLSLGQADQVCDAVRSFGHVPLLLDWRDKSPLRHEHPSVGGYPRSLEWGRSAEHNCAVISLCRAFVGIDSGPSKCASATDTPALVVWTGHHPAQFHDPAPNTTHLVPLGYHGLFPVCNDPKVIEWFEAHYNVTYYDRDPVPMAKLWLKEVL